MEAVLCRLHFKNVFYYCCSRSNMCHGRWKVTFTSASSGPVIGGFIREINLRVVMDKIQASNWLCCSCHLTARNVDIAMIKQCMWLCVCVNVFERVIDYEANRNRERERERERDRQSGGKERERLVGVLHGYLSACCSYHILETVWSLSSPYCVTLQSICTTNERTTMSVCQR